MLWTTRDYVHVDRVACPWLIRRFIDSRAQFVFLPREEITKFVKKTGAIPFDTGTGIELDHYEADGIKHCTFDAIVR
ncbi:MAG: chromate resistance protein ChrB domain-containing protein, partial [Promethearchaeota archaeon]